MVHELHQYPLKGKIPAEFHKLHPYITTIPPSPTRRTILSNLCEGNEGEAASTRITNYNTELREHTVTRPLGGKRHQSALQIRISNPEHILISDPKIDIKIARSIIAKRRHPL